MKTLRTRLILSHLLPVLVIIPVVIGIFVYLLETQVFLSNITGEITRQAILVSDVASDYTEIWFDTSRAQTFVDRISPSLTADVLLIDAQGRLVVSSNSSDKPSVGKVLFTPDYEQFLAGGEKAQVQKNANGTITDVTVPVIIPSGHVAGFVRLVNPLASVFERSSQLRQIAIYLLVGGLLLGVLMGWILANDIQKPLRDTTSAVYELANGRQLTPLKEQGPEEIRLLLRAFNTLVERLRTLEESRRRLLANLVHELGRPLGALQSAVQALSGGADEDVPLRKELLIGMDDELHRMRHLVDDLASLHEQVLGSLELNTQPVNVSEWLSRISAPWREAVLDKELKWESQIADNLPIVQMDPDRMAQSVGNLLSNAIRYTPPGGQVCLSADVKDGMLYIQVSDSGPGIATGEQVQIFNPFYRGKAARRFSDGMGLGLTIARDLVAGHGGELLVESQSGQGSTFIIRLPLQPGEQTMNLPPVS